MKKLIICLFIMLFAVNVWASDETAEIDYDKLSIEELAKYADNNDTRAQVLLGSKYLGSDVPDYKKALKYLKLAADKGYAPGQWGYGLMLEHGFGVKPNLKEAIRWYEKAAAQNSEDAQFTLGSLYYEGKGVKQDYLKAFELYKNAAENGHIKASENVAIMYLKGLGVQQNYDKAYEWASKYPDSEQAKPIITVSAFNKGLRLYRNDNVKESVDWFEIAANNGDTDAMATLAMIYYDGEDDVAKDENAYVEWIKKAADKGNGLALFEMAHWQAEGFFDYKKDQNKAKKLLEQAYNTGSFSVAFIMAIHSMEESNLLGPADKTKAMEYLAEAKKRLVNGNDMYFANFKKPINEVLDEYSNYIKNMPDIIVTAAQLSKDYNENEVAASMKYKGKLIQVSGKISSIDRDIFDKNSIVKLQVSGNYGLDDVYCHFKSTDDAVIATLKKGQTITIIGTGDTFLMGSPQLKKCTVQK